MERLGRYEIVAHLAQGGMGRVSLGVAIGPGGFERHVILKTLELTGMDDDEATAMFLDEARLLGMLHHQHLATIHEVAVDQDDKLFLVLEYVHGHTAHDVWESALDHHVELPLDFTITVVTAACAGLHYAHTRRAPDGNQLHLVHRDVTLSNLMIGFDGSVKVIDFGIAKAAVRSARTQIGYVKGKVGYMAPEQLRGQAVDARTDVFALGIVLYELTTMRRAFREPTDRATVERIKYGRIVKPSEIVPGYPRDLEDIVLQALHVDPAKRFQDADAMRRELEALGHRYRLVLGDAAVSEVLNQLFTDHEEPWLARSTSRAEGEVAVAVEENDTGLTTVLLDPADAALTPTPLPADDLVIAVAEPNTLPVAQPRPTPRAQTVIGPGIAPRNPNDSKPPVLASELAAEALAIPLIAPADDSFAGSRAVTALRKPKKRGGRAWIGFTIVGLVLAGAAGGAVYMFEMGESATAAARPSPPAPAPAAAPVAARQSAPKPPPAPAPAPVVKPTVAPTSVELVIETVPSDATVLLDGQRLGHTPYRGAVDAKPGGHVLKIRRRGCVTQKLDIELTGDVKRDVELAALEGDAGDECQRSREAQQVQLR